MTGRIFSPLLMALKKGKYCRYTFKNLELQIYRVCLSHFPTRTPRTPQNVSWNPPKESLWESMLVLDKKRTKGWALMYLIVFVTFTPSVLFGFTLYLIKHNDSSIFWRDRLPNLPIPRLIYRMKINSTRGRKSFFWNQYHHHA